MCFRFWVVQTLAFIQSIMHFTITLYTTLSCSEKFEVTKKKEKKRKEKIQKTQKKVEKKKEKEVEKKEQKNC